MATQWWDYVQRNLDRREWRTSDLAKRSGIAHSVLSRWKSGEVDPGHVAARRVAEAFGRPVREAFIAAGILTENEAGAQVILDADLSTVPARELLAEIERRINAAEAPGNGTVRPLRPATVPEPEEPDPGRKGQQYAARKRPPRS